MPVVGHETVRKKRDAESPDGFRKDLLEREVVTMILEKRNTFGRSVHDMEYQPGIGRTSSSRHAPG
jgi:hypothetical protein